MKKLIALIATVSVFVGMTATAFATTTPTVAENGAIAKNDDGSFTLNGEAVDMNVVNDVKEDIKNNNQTTIVLVEGTEITTSSIQYINQDSKTSFTFIPKDDTTYKAGSKEVVLNAYIGGDGITKTAAGTITYAVDKVEYAVTFVVDGTTVSEAKYEAGKAITAPADPEKTGFTFKGWTATEGSTVVADLTKGVTEATTFYPIWEAVQSGVETTTYVIGDADLSGDITTADLTALRAYLKLNKNSNTRYHVNEDLPYTAENKTYKVGDSDLSGDIATADLTALRAYLKLNKNSNTRYHVNEEVTVDK